MTPELLKKIKEMGIIYYSDCSSKDLETSLSVIEKHNKECPDDMMKFQLGLITKYRQEIFKLPPNIQDLYFNSLTSIVSTLWYSEVNNSIIEETVKAVTQIYITQNI